MVEARAALITGALLSSDDWISAGTRRLLDIRLEPVKVTIIIFVSGNCTKLPGEKIPGFPKLALLKQKVYLML